MVELDTEGQLSRSQVAEFLREFANELEPGLEGRGGDERVEEGRESGQRTEGARASTGERAESREPGKDANDTRRITLIVGSDSATVTVPESVMFDVEVGSRSPMLSSGVKQEIDLELSWQIENPDEISEDWLDIE